MQIMQHLTNTELHQIKKRDACKQYKDNARHEHAQRDNIETAEDCNDTAKNMTLSNIIAIVITYANNILNELYSMILSWAYSP